MLFNAGAQPGRRVRACAPEGLSGRDVKRSGSRLLRAGDPEVGDAVAIFPNPSVSDPAARMTGAEGQVELHLRVARFGTPISKATIGL